MNAKSFKEPSTIINCNITDKFRYALNLKGKLYRWEPDKEPKSKLFLSGPIR